MKINLSIGYMIICITDCIFRHYVLYRIPRLKFLDSSPVKTADLEEAKRVGPFMKMVRGSDDVVCNRIWVPSEDSDQPGHLPSLIRVFAVRLKKTRILSYPLSAQQRLWSDWADAQADLSLHWVHMPFCWFCHDAAHLLYPKNSDTPKIVVMILKLEQYHFTTE